MKAYCAKCWSTLDSHTSSDGNIVVNPCQHCIDLALEAQAEAMEDSYREEIMQMETMEIADEW